MAREKSPEAFRTIREIAEELVLPQHVLRFWEQRFTQIAPVKRAGGRRYYRPEDIALIRRIKGLLHDEGYTIKGVQKLLLDEAASPLLQQKRSRQAQPDITKHPAEKDLFVADSIAIPRDRLQAILDGLIALRSQLGQNDER